MELRHLRYFVAIADSPTMAMAAQAMFVTQSTLSHQLSQLEQELECELFERVGRTLKISSEGKQFLVYAREILNQSQESKRILAQSKSLEIGSLHIGVVHSFLTSLLPAAIEKFSSKHPNIQLQIEELTANDIETKVHAGILEVGMAFYPASSDQVTAEKLFDDRLVFAVHQSHALANRKTIRFNQIADIPQAMLGKRFATRRLIDGYFQRAGFQPKIKIEIDSVYALQRLVELNVASALLPSRSIKASKQIRLIQVTDPVLSRAAGLIWRTTNYRSAAAKAFVQVLREIDFTTS